jgi:enoyl-CoA hydratase
MSIGTDSGRVDIEVRADVATISLRRSDKRNALTPEMLDELGAAIEAVARSQARVLLVRGEGAKAFCVGADIDRFAGLTPVQMLDWTARGHRVFDALAQLPQPSIAVLHAPAFGGGLELALACDLRVMSADASLGLPEVGLGTVPGWGGTERLTELVGRARAKEVILARRTLDSGTALNWGVVNEVAELPALEDVVADLLGGICAGGPIAVSLAKTLIDAAADGAPARVLERLAGAVTSSTNDLMAGIEGFRTRTTPLFSGS